MRLLSAGDSRNRAGSSALFDSYQTGLGPLASDSIFDGSTFRGGSTRASWTVLDCVMTEYQALQVRMTIGMSTAVSWESIASRSSLVLNTFAAAMVTGVVPRCSKENEAGLKEFT